MSALASEHPRRRAQLAAMIAAPVLLLGNGPRDRNLPGYGLPFRQDSTFLYFTGCALPGAAALLDVDGFTLFLPSPHPEDALWHGPGPSLEELGALHGADRVRDIAALAVPPGTLTLAVADESRNQRGEALTGVPLEFGRQYGSSLLVDAVIALRRSKSPAELAEMRSAARHTRAAFELVMGATRPGGHERHLTALFHGALAARGLTTGYDTILTQSGEILHHHGHDHPLEDGRLLLLDGGGELPSGYGVDITRTWPVSGRFTPRQRAAYDAVLAAQSAAIRAIRAGVRYREVHDTSSLEIARFLVDERLLRGTPESAVETGAHALFYPHGVGHHLGLDVHDLEMFGDRPSYPVGQGRPEQFGTRNLRLDLPLEAGWVVTVEPGFYVAPTILADRTLRERFAEQVDFDRAARWVGFGGIRIEDDVHVTSDGVEVLTSVPRAPAEVEALIGAGPSAEERLGA